MPDNINRKIYIYKNTIDDGAPLRRERETNFEWVARQSQHSPKKIIIKFFQISIFFLNL